MQFKKIFIITVIFLSVAPILAHEFWLEPQQYIYTRGDEINIRFKAGESFTGENWKGNRDKVNELTLYYADVVDNLNNGLCDDEGDSLQFSFFEEGTVMVAFNNINSYISSDAAAFNAYLKHDGLQAAIDYRTNFNETDSAGRELYQRSVKTIVQVGTVKTDIYKKPTTLPVDIIPLSHPYRLKNGDTLNVKVLFKGEPLANSKIRTWHKLPGSVTDTFFISNDKGEIRFPVNTTGEWMVSCVTMIRITDDPIAQWQSYWGSLTWGYTGNNFASDKSR